LGRKEEYFGRHREKKGRVQTGLGRFSFQVETEKKRKKDLANQERRRQLKGTTSKRIDALRKER